MSLIALEKKESQNLCYKLKKIQLMKWLLNIERIDKEVVFEELEHEINEIAYNNFTYLTVVHQFTINFPKAMKKLFFQLLSLEQNKTAYSLMYKKFKQDINNKLDFIEFERYVNLQIRDNYDMKIEADERVYDILIFKILEDYIDSSNFQKENLVYNFPYLYKWIYEYRNKPIKALTDDECKIITAIVNLMSYEKIIQYCNLDILNQTSEAIEKIISNLPEKFYVKNLTQVIFRIILIKPYIFELYDNNLIIKSLKGLRNELPM